MSTLILVGRVSSGLVGRKKKSSLPPPMAHFLPHVLFSIITREKLCRFSVSKKKKKKEAAANNSLCELETSVALQKLGKLSHPSYEIFRNF